jgi:RNA polymerase sigma-B factor
MLPRLADPPTGCDDGTRRRRAAATQLFRSYSRDRDPRLRDRLIEEHLPLANAIAARFARREPELADELRQVAALALIKAVDRYDVTRGTAFSTFAVPTIQGEIRRYFRDFTWAVRVPRDLQERAVRIQRDRDVLGERLGRSPTVRELADWTDDTMEDVLDAMAAMRARRGESLDRTYDSDEEEPRALVDRLGEDDPALADAEARASLAPLLGTLSARERAVVRLYVEEDLTQTEIAQRLGCSQMHVSRIYRGAIEHLRATSEAQR